MCLLKLSHIFSQVELNIWASYLKKKKNGCGNIYTSSAFKIQCFQLTYQQTLQYMITLSVLIYTVAYIQLVLNWDMNSQPLGPQHTNLPATPPCLCQ